MRLASTALLGHVVMHNDWDLTCDTQSEAQIPLYKKSRSARFLEYDFSSNPQKTV